MERMIEIKPSELMQHTETSKKPEPSTEALKQDNTKLKQPENNKSQTENLENKKKIKDETDTKDNQEEPDKETLDNQNLDDPAKKTQPNQEKELTEKPEENEPSTDHQTESQIKEPENEDTIWNDPYYTENISEEPLDYDNYDPDLYDNYTDEDIRQLEAEDPGYINDKVLDYDHPDYLKNGTHRIKWGNDSSDTPHQETLEPGTRLSRIGDEGGQYLGDSGVDYDDRQLPIYEGKQPLHEYEVIKPLNVEQSTIAKQDWGPEMKNSDAQQYKTDRPIKELIDDGYLREIPADKNGGTDWSRTSINPEQEAQIKKTGNTTPEQVEDHHKKNNLTTVPISDSNDLFTPQSIKDFNQAYPLRNQDGNPVDPAGNKPAAEYSGPNIDKKAGLIPSLAVNGYMKTALNASDAGYQTARAYIVGEAGKWVSGKVMDQIGAKVLGGGDSPSEPADAAKNVIDWASRNYDVHYASKNPGAVIDFSPSPVSQEQIDRNTLVLDPDDLPSSSLDYDLPDYDLPEYNSSEITNDM